MAAPETVLLPSMDIQIKRLLGDKAIIAQQQPATSSSTKELDVVH
jgi:hypothetical protein